MICVNCLKELASADSQIVAAVLKAAKEWGVSVAAVFGKTHSSRVVKARHQAWIELKELGFTYVEIGKWFDCDHSTVISAYKKARKNGKEAEKENRNAENRDEETSA